MHHSGVIFNLYLCLCCVQTWITWYMIWLVFQCKSPAKRTVCLGKHVACITFNQATFLNIFSCLTKKKKREICRWEQLNGGFGYSETSYYNWLCGAEGSRAELHWDWAEKPVRLSHSNQICCLVWGGRRDLAIFILFCCFSVDRSCFHM